MSQGKRPGRPSLHAYQPLIVDEDGLTDEDCREAILDAIAHPRSWKSFVTQQERETLEKELAEIERQAEIKRRNTPGLLYSSEPYSMSAKRHELVRRGAFRAYARAKYANGGSIWYGDGAPPWDR